MNSKLKSFLWSPLYRVNISRKSDLYLTVKALLKHPFLIFYLGSSRAQLKQDYFAVLNLDFRKLRGNSGNSGFFVEFGSTDGVSLSNTLLFEEAFGFKGILVEPARCWARALESNRSCILDFRCVAENTGELVKFDEMQIAELSGRNLGKEGEFSDSAKRIGLSEQYEVETVSLFDLLEYYQAPKLIQYISIDTEGTEFQIIKNFDFDSYAFEVISIEHNYGPEREKIHSLLISKGYERRQTNWSLWDDWYVLVKGRGNHFDR